MTKVLAGAPMSYTSGTTGRPKGVRSNLLQVGGDPAEALEQLRMFMAPRSYDFGDLPRTPTGNLPKRELRAKYWAGTGRSI